MFTHTSILTLLIAVPTLLAGDTTIQVPEAKAVDQELRDLSCSVSEGAFLAGPAVVASLAGRKAALDACAPEGAAIELRWSWSGETEADIEAQADKATALNSCVEAALQAVPKAIEGHCDAIVLIGEPEAAEQAAASLLTPKDDGAGS